MKIAIVTNDGRTVSQHFGRARYYLVVSVENNQVTKRELRPRIVPHHHGGQHGHEHHPEHGHGQGRGHGFGPGAAARHAAMAEQIKDCDVLIVGGMGMGAYESMKQAGIEPIATDIRDIEQVLGAYIGGTLVNKARRVH